MMPATPPIDYLEAALAAHAAGLSVLPPEQDGSKRPIGGVGWKQYQETPASEIRIRRWFRGGHRTGLGAVTGNVSGNLEVMDFDDVPTYEAFLNAAHAAGLTALIERVMGGYVERTPRGVHWFYRCAQIGGNAKLARRLKTPDEQRDPNDRVKATIETRGEGGYVIMAPSNGTVHPDGGRYRVASGHVSRIAHITPAERADLHRVARLFDQLDAKRTREPEPARVPETEGRPGDDFNARASWGDVLVPHGWTHVYNHGGADYWRRPGKAEGISASTNYGGSPYLYVWSTSTPFEAERGYSKFSAYALLAHGGDVRAAARELATKGYGRQSTPGPAVVLEDDEPSLKVDPETGEIREAAPAWQFEIIDGPDFMDRPPLPWLVQGVVGQGRFACVYGKPGSFKTFVMLDLALCIATGQPWHGRPVQQGAVLYIAGEGADDLTDRMRAWRIGNETDIPRDFKIMPNILPLTMTDQVEALIREIRQRYPGLAFSMIVVDTLSRALAGKDENNQADMSLAVASAAMIQGALGCTVVVVHHGTKADGSLRGSSVLEGALDTTIKVKASAPESTSRQLTLYCEKMRGGPQFVPVHFEPVTVEVRDAPADPDPWVVAPSTSSAYLRIAERGAPARIDDVFKLGKKQRQFAMALVREYGTTPVTHAEWWTACRRNGAGTTDRESFTAVRKALISKGLVVELEQVNIGGDALYQASDALVDDMGARSTEMD